MITNNKKTKTFKEIIKNKKCKVKIILKINKINLIKIT
jgi:hypothetical protein